MPVNAYPVAEIVVAAAQVEILGHIDTIKALIGGNAAAGGFTDGDKIDPALDAQINEELDALKVGIDAAPVA